MCDLALESFLDHTVYLEDSEESLKTLRHSVRSLIRDRLFLQHFPFWRFAEVN